MKAKDKRINLRVPESTYEWLKVKASDSSITMTELVNRLLLKSIKELEELNEPKQF